MLVHYARALQEADEVVATIRGNGGHANALGADLSVPSGPETLAEQVRNLVGERLDILVLNAGVSKATPLAAYTAPDIDALFATNVRGPFLLVQQLVPLLGEGSNIVVVTSAVARTVVGAAGPRETPPFLLLMPRPKVHWRPL